MNVIEVRELHKSFGKVQALRGLNLEVPQGKVLGFLGPNGSGKTTTIRILLGLLRSDKGTISLFGGDPWKDAVELHKKLVYVPGDVALWPKLTGGEVIDVLSSLIGGLEPERKKRMIEKFDLDPTKKARTYSKGNRQKVALVAALASRAELLILDEPTSGLDPLMEAAFTDCIQEIKKEGRSVLLSSHIFSEVEKLADTITIIKEGVTVESGTLAELRHLTRTHISVILKKDASALRSFNGIHDFRVEGQHISFSLDNEAMPAVLGQIAAMDPIGLTVNPPSLEDLFLSHYKSGDGTVSGK
ncbi:ATP-binding cassette domain-containing protein [Candidatus Clostridium radicumherbarum]|uniref:ATP-binding cassette domain-containing protein n=1 Tax=Candidatus Clostridium radicumherbarum TaxID=3381662 RepID=A0ABW8TSV9_9CLOT